MPTILPVKEVLIFVLVRIKTTAACISLEKYGEEQTYENRQAQRKINAKLRTMEVSLLLRQ